MSFQQPPYPAYPGYDFGFGQQSQQQAQQSPCEDNNNDLQATSLVLNQAAIADIAAAVASSIPTPAVVTPTAAVLTLAADVTITAVAGAPAALNGTYNIVSNNDPFATINPANGSLTYTGTSPAIYNVTIQNQLTNSGSGLTVATVGISRSVPSVAPNYIYNSTTTIAPAYIDNVQGKYVVTMNPGQIIYPAMIVDSSAANVITFNATVPTIALGASSFVTYERRP